MSLLLCCLLGNNKTIDNNIDKNFNKVNKKVNKNILNEVNNIETTIINDDNINNIDMKRKNSKIQDTLIEINEFDKCKYWFNEILKCSIYNYEGYGKNKKELFEYIFKSIDLNKILQYYKIYNKKNNNFNTENIKKFVNNKDNIDLIQDIKINEHIYRFH